MKIPMTEEQVKNLLLAVDIMIDLSVDKDKQLYRKLWIHIAQYIGWFKPEYMKI